MPAKDCREREGDLDAYLLLVIKTTSQETARAVIEEHQANCPINSIKREFYGDGTELLPGVKTDVVRLKTDIKGLKDCKNNIGSFLRDKLIAPIVTAVVVALVMGLLFGRPAAKAESKDLTAKTESHVQK